MTRQAACCCGAASVTVTGEPDVNGVCHCADCKRRTGSAFGWQVYFPDAAVTAKTGPLSRYQVGDPQRQERFFCTACGSTLFWASSFLPSHTAIAVGNFADAAFPEPTMTVFNDKRCAWLGCPRPGAAVSPRRPDAMQVAIAGAGINGQWLEASNDAEAKDRAEEFCEDGVPTIELWQAARLVDEIDCEERGDCDTGA